MPASGSATVQLSRLLDHGIERRDWSPRRGSKFHRRTPHKRRAARLWRVVRSFVCCTCTCTHARVRAHAFAHAKARSADLSSNLPKVAARKSCVQLLPPHMGDTVPLLKPHPIRGNTRYALRPSPRGGDETNQLALDSTSNRYASLVGVDHYQSDWYQRPQRGTTYRGGGASAQRPAPPLRTAGVPAAPGERASALRPARSPRVATTALKRQSALPHPTR